MNNRELFSIFMIAIAVWLVSSAVWTLCNIFFTVATTPRSDIPTILSALQSLRNTALIQLWIGTFIGLYGLTYAGGGKDFEIDEWFYWSFLAIAAVSSLLALFI
jgi:hypothetical protein